MKSLLPRKYHSYIYIFSLILLVIGLPLSKFLLSLSQIILLVNWILEGDLKNKFRSFFRNKAALAASSILLLHFIGLLYTSDLRFGFNDIRIKLPLLILPLIFSTAEPLTLKMRALVLKFLAAAVTLSTIISTLILTDVIHREIADVRYVSVFISHVRLALLICLVIFSCAWLFMQPSERKWRWAYAALIAWLFTFLILVESITGISVLFFATALYMLYILLRSDRQVLKYTVVLLIIASVSGAGYFIYSTWQRYAVADVVDEAGLEKVTAQGHTYYHAITGDAPTENGHYVWLYYCEEELREEWNKRSTFPFDGNNMRGDKLSYTIARFMASKDLRKDAEGVKQLSDAEIRAIEKGIANVDYMSRLKGRICETIWEIRLYAKTGDANGHSLTQRFEYWKAAAGIIAENPVLGVGTGDLQLAFTAQYEKNRTTLAKEWRLRSHNQYLSIAVGFGFFGLAWFLFSLIYPGIRLKRFPDFLYFTFFVVAACSFLTEDTLETQVGVTFYAFFNAFFLFAFPAKEEPGL
ncbi:MAG: hypothetical protein JWO09_1653 [Bacteroidetes bacterium]|nr:hypothetical protein [Bacteroidota bacterium]